MPEIDASIQDLAVISKLAWAALQKRNHPPYLFRQGRSMVRLQVDESHSPILHALNPDGLRHELARAARWVSPDGKDKPPKDAKPPMDVVRDMLAAPQFPLPAINRITQVPVFAANGELKTHKGYHEGAGIYFAPAKGLTMPEVPKTPFSEDIKAARSLILNDLLFDFPFVTDGDRANAVALFLLPFARDLIEGPTPCHLVEAPVAGTGKGLLADVTLRPAVGRHIGIIAQARDGDEWRKRLTACFRELHEIILIDNLTTTLDSGELAAALTAPTWTDRILGRNETGRYAVRCVWVCTANNPTMSTEIARRCVRLRLDSGLGRPWIDRDGYKHPDLREWTDNNRGRLVWSALVLIQAWLAAGRPQPRCKPLGSYEAWSRTIGGILENAGIEGFLDNLDAFYEASDLEGAIWREFVQVWAKEYKTKVVSVADLFELAQDSDGLEFGGATERARRISFGKQLAKQRDRVIGEFRIVECGKVQHAKQWRLLPVEPGCK